MSQRAALDDLVMTMAEAFGEVGFCDTGAYLTPVPDGDPPATPIACHLFIDDASQQHGDAQLITGAQTTITLLRSEIPDPERRAAVEADGRRFILDTADPSLQTTAESRWWVIEEAVDGD